VIGDRGARRLRHLTVVAQVLASGCSNDATPDLPSDNNSNSTTKPQPWLGPRDDLAPERWLLDQPSASGVTNPPSAVEIRNILVRVGQRFADSPRMVANRIVQLEAMLAQHGIKENALDLLQDLSLSAPRERHAEGFGARCQQYYLLRLRSQSKQQALSALNASNDGGIRECPPPRHQLARSPSWLHRIGLRSCCGTAARYALAF
jgi:hypothetical protein